MVASTVLGENIGCEFPQARNSLPVLVHKGNMYLPNGPRRLPEKFQLNIFGTDRWQATVHFLWWGQSKTRYDFYS